jgi:hypothetical protein
MARLCVLTWVEQPMEMDDEIAHLGVVHSLLRLGFPGREGSRVIRVYADDFYLVEILERNVFKICQLAADDEMKQLLRGTIWHDSFS